MRYLGGKCLISKEIARFINCQQSRQFVSLFCGGCAVESKLSGFDKIVCNDKHEYLIAMFRALQAGWIPPDVVSKSEYQYIRAHKDENKALSGFVGFGCSFGGKWFGGYAPTTKNHGGYPASAAKNALLRDIQALKTATFTCRDYRDVPLPSHCVIYADPPYVGTVQYKGAGKFSSADFWKYMRRVSCKHVALISEQTAPPDFVSVLQKAKRRTINCDKSNQPMRIEHLFVHRSVIESGRFIEPI